MPGPLHPDTDRIVFNGVPFRRYPNSPRLELRRYYVAQRGHRLHQAVWEFHNGPIHPGHHVHHKDGDTLNNDISNLECIPASEHAREHGSRERTERQREHIERIRPLAAEWHRSAEGRAWHVDHAKQVFANLEPVDRKCERCGADYQTKKPAGSRFCSNACKAADRRDAGVDDVDRVCAVCGITFRVNKYDKTQSCSRKCGVRLTSRTKRGGV